MGGLEAPNTFRLRNYLPVLLTLIMTWIFSSMMASLRIRPERPVITPLEEPGPQAHPVEALSSPAPYLNTLIFISIIAVSGVFLLYLARRSPRAFRVLTVLLMSVVSFGVTALYILVGAFLLGAHYQHSMIAASVIVAALVVYSMVRGGEVAASLASAYVASGAGAVIGISVPMWTFLVLVVGISVYDVLAVFRGHLSTISKIDAASLRGLVVEVGDVTIGLGDLFFYSLAISAIHTYFGPMSAASATACIILGYMAVLRALSRRRQMPGLPIPLLLALASAYIVKALAAG